MMKQWLSICLLLLLTMHAAAKKNDEITVLQWNIWQEGTLVEDGFQTIVNEVVRLKPDFLTLSEVRNYGNTNFTRRLTEALSQHGLSYYSFYTHDTGVLSRYPIQDSVVVFPLNKDHGTIHKITTKAKGNIFSVYTAHLDYLDCAYYNVRGYDGYTWKETPRPTSVEELLRLNNLSWRENAVQIFLNEARHDIQAGHIVLLGGDFNEPSHQDWTAETAHLYDHHGFVVPWTVSEMLHKAEFHDSYRVVHPDVLTHPGFTYPCFNPDVPISKLTWAPKADERERIDFIYYKGNNIYPVDAKLFGPAASVCRSEAINDNFQDAFIKPLGKWPTDHKGVWVKFRIDR